MEQQTFMVIEHLWGADADGRAHEEMVTAADSKQVLPRQIKMTGT